MNVIVLFLQLNAVPYRLSSKTANQFNLKFTRKTYLLPPELDDEEEEEPLLELPPVEPPEDLEGAGDLTEPPEDLEGAGDLTEPPEDLEGAGELTEPPDDLEGGGELTDLPEGRDPDVLAGLL